MASKITVPKLGMGTAPVTLVEWVVKEGEWVEQGKVVLIVETEKIRHDVSAKSSGFIHIIAKEGIDAPIGSAAALLAETEEELAALQKEAVPEAAAASEAPAEKAAVAPKTASGVRREGRVAISPAARKLAEANSVDIATVEGTGPKRDG